MRQEFYDAGRSYEENYDAGPYGNFQDSPKETLEKGTFDFLGFPVDIPFGIPAGPLLNSNFIKAAWSWGFSLATYKTVRGEEYRGHPFPNVVKVIVTHNDIHPGETIRGDLDISAIDVTKDGITNSFGVPSKPVALWETDVREAVKKMDQGNLLILSFMGTKHEGMSRNEYIENFIDTCKLAKQTGAPVLEVNLSCPNVGREGLICNDIQTSSDILEGLHSVKGNTPLLVKIGYFNKEQQDDLEKLLESIHTYADGVVSINTLPAKVVSENGDQLLPGNPIRIESGVCGAPIRWAGLEMAGRIMTIKRKNGWKNFAVVGVGGVISPDDYVAYMNLGVDAVQSATGAMWRPDLAIEIRKLLKQGGKHG